MESSPWYHLQADPGHIKLKTKFKSKSKIEIPMIMTLEAPTESAKNSMHY